ncbi:RNA polymerase sigma factor [Brevibacillus sp. 179-C9.3 HS]|uniref:RNA polymerase sigma factor n=1 Tax=unclassified Brevibacillus TaxID=2684853 RepID=UPI00399EEB0A
MQDDKAIIEEVLQGNKEAYAHIIDKYHEKIVFIIHKRLGNPQNVQDIVQEIFIKAYYHLPEYKAHFEFGGWLYRIAANHCLDVLRKWKRTPTITGEDYELADTRTPEMVYLEKEQQSFIRQQLMTIEEKYRIVLELRYLRFLSYEEISQRLSVPVTTVRARLSRGKSKLLAAIVKIRKRGDFH